MVLGVAITLGTIAYNNYWLIANGLFAYNVYSTGKKYVDNGAVTAYVGKGIVNSMSNGISSGANYVYNWWYSDKTDNVNNSNIELNNLDESEFSDDEVVVVIYN